MTGEGEEAEPGPKPEQKRKETFNGAIRQVSNNPGQRDRGYGWKEK